MPLCELSTQGLSEPRPNSDDDGGSKDLATRDSASLEQQTEAHTCGGAARTRRAVIFLLQ
ncbi:hypothetical protein E1A91_D01G156200v1 [Gossypium mustelinum]|uniref:Uncharacterized protein n=1 Tax=Gossypium mustelinum TaxID=34275 RepID=A0A5D2W7D1_GOSMU|nr:hypothetical protein E1A91_D01G156200v1 [Gossypium mustelinum]